MNQNTLELSDKYIEKVLEKDELDAQIKAVKAEVESLQRELLEAMTNDELDKFTRNGVQFVASNSVHYSNFGDERKEQLWDVMKKNGFESLFSIPANTLSSEIKKLFEDKDKDSSWLDGLVNQYEKSSIKVYGKSNYKKGDL